jgi:hypothetical protein
MEKGRGLRLSFFTAPGGGPDFLITGRNTTINFVNPNDPVTATNLPFDANGNVVASRSLPRGAGFGVANGYQAPRQVQLQIRFRF